MKSLTFNANNARLTVTTTPWSQASVDALVLSANNRLILKGASGNAGWVYKQRPDLHDTCQRFRVAKEETPNRGIPPGSGMITDGPDHRWIIHAVSVDYDHPLFPSKPYAGIDTVSSATTFALEMATRYNIESMAFAPMCTRGHARFTMPTQLAARLFPQVQAQVIMGAVLAHPHLTALREVIFCTNDAIDDPLQLNSFQIVADTWQDGLRYVMR